MHSHGSFAALPLAWYWEYTRNQTFLTDRTLATADVSKNDELCIKNEKLRIKIQEFVFKTMNSAADCYPIRALQRVGELVGLSPDKGG